MNIRKIIREEANDFEWTKYIPDTRADYLLGQLSNKERETPWSTRQALKKRGYTDNDIMDTLAKHHQPRKRFNHEYDEDVVYWTTNHGSSTFQFNYPPRENTLTKKFIDYIKENPSGTKQDFYIEVLGEPYRKGHNGQFWTSIVASG